MKSLHQRSGRHCLPAVDIYGQGLGVRLQHCAFSALSVHERTQPHTTARYRSKEVGFS